MASIVSAAGSSLVATAAMCAAKVRYYLNQHHPRRGRRDAVINILTVRKTGSTRSSSCFSNQMNRIAGSRSKWFGDEDVSYASDDFRSLINVMLMNVGTGTGTLVHELTHAPIKPDFPQVPAWFNEGLAAACSSNARWPAATSAGWVTNWRLPDLQRAIRKERIALDRARLAKDEDFYGQRTRRHQLNACRARYLR